MKVRVILGPFDDYKEKMIETSLESREASEEELEAAARYFADKIKQNN